MAKTFVQRVSAYADRIPEILVFVDDDGKPWYDIEPLKLSKADRVLLASYCVKNKQSLETAIQRILRAQLRKTK